MFTVLCHCQLELWYVLEKRVERILGRILPWELETHVNLEPGNCIPLVNLKGRGSLEYHQCEEGMTTVGRRNVCPAKDMGFSHGPSGGR